MIANEKEEIRSEENRSQEEINRLNAEAKEANGEAETTPDGAAAADADTAAAEAEATPEQQVAELQAQLERQKDDYLRLMAEFDNYRKNMLKKLQDSMKYGSEKALTELLPVVDDFERALANIGKSETVEAAAEGVELIYKKFQTYLTKQKVSEIPAAQGDAFDEAIHNAVTMFPAPDPSLKGKVVDCVEKGYKLDDKVIRYAKVVVGQ